MRMGVIFGLFSAAVAVALTLLLGELGKRDSELQVRRMLEQSARKLAGSLHIGIHERSLDVEALAQILRSHLAEPQQPFVRELLTDFQKTNHRYTLIAVADLDGRIVTASAPELCRYRWSATRMGSGRSRSASWATRGSSAPKRVPST